METQTRFDLNISIENWRAELAAQSDLTTEARRELETHLRDSMTGLRAHGLDEAEAFLVARRRVGMAGQLSEEFAKADPAAVWRERVFWMALAGLLIWLWNGTSSIIAMMVTNLIRNSFITMGLHSPPFLEFGLETFSIAILILPVCWLAYYVVKGRINETTRWLSPARLLTVAFVWSLCATTIAIWIAWLSVQAQAQMLDHGAGFGVSFPFVRNLIHMLSFPLTLIALLVRLKPARFQRKPKVA